jgi:hypothetical protein
MKTGKEILEKWETIPNPDKQLFEMIDEAIKEAWEEGYSKCEDDEDFHRRNFGM